MPDDMTDTDALDFYDIVATGTLYKRIQERSAWTQRKLVVCGQYIYQFTKNDVYKGKFDVIGCSLKIVDSKNFDIPRGHYGFSIENTSEKSYSETGSTIIGRSILFCTPSVGTLFSWLNALSEQIADYMDEYRIFLKRGEIVVANSNAWVYKSVEDSTAAASTNKDENKDKEGDKLRVLVTNLPRILLLEREVSGVSESQMDSDEVPVYKVKEQRAWSEASHPSLFVVNNDRLKISFREMTTPASSPSSGQGLQGQGQGLYQQKVSYLFTDYENGFTYWREAFADLQYRELLSSAGGVHPVAISADGDDDDAESVGWSFNRDKAVIEDDDFDSDDDEDAVYGVNGGRILPPPAVVDRSGLGDSGSVSTMSVESSSKKSNRDKDKGKVDKGRDSEKSSGSVNRASASTRVGMREPRPYYSAAAAAAASSSSSSPSSSSPSDGYPNNSIEKEAAAAALSSSAVTITNISNSSSSGSAVITRLGSDNDRDVNLHDRDRRDHPPRDILRRFTGSGKEVIGVGTDIGGAFPRSPPPGSPAPPPSTLSIAGDDTTNNFNNSTPGNKYSNAPSNTPSNSIPGNSNSISGTSVHSGALDLTPFKSTTRTSPGSQRDELAAAAATVATTPTSSPPYQPIHSPQDAFARTDASPGPSAVFGVTDEDTRPSISPRAGAGQVVTRSATAVARQGSDPTPCLVAGTVDFIHTDNETNKDKDNTGTTSGSGNDRGTSSGSSSGGIGNGDVTTVTDDGRIYNGGKSSLTVRQSQAEDSESPYTTSSSTPATVATTTGASQSSSSLASGPSSSPSSSSSSSSSLPSSSLPSSLAAPQLSSSTPALPALPVALNVPSPRSREIAPGSGLATGAGLAPGLGAAISMSERVAATFAAKAVARNEAAGTASSSSSPLSSDIAIVTPFSVDNPLNKATKKQGSPSSSSSSSSSMSPSSSSLVDDFPRESREGSIPSDQETRASPQPYSTEIRASPQPYSTETTANPQPYSTETTANPQPYSTETRADHTLTRAPVPTPAHALTPLITSPATTTPTTTTAAAATVSGTLDIVPTVGTSKSLSIVTSIAPENGTATGKETRGTSLLLSTSSPKHAPPPPPTPSPYKSIPANTSSPGPSSGPSPTIHALGQSPLFTTTDKNTVIQQNSGVYPPPLPPSPTAAQPILSRPPLSPPPATAVSLPSSSSSPSTSSPRVSVFLQLSQKSPSTSVKEPESPSTSSKDASSLVPPSTSSSGRDDSRDSPVLRAFDPPVVSLPATATVTATLPLPSTPTPTPTPTPITISQPNSNHIPPPGHPSVTNPNPPHLPPTTDIGIGIGRGNGIGSGTAGTSSYQPEIPATDSDPRAHPSAMSTRSTAMSLAQTRNDTVGGEGEMEDGMVKEEEAAPRNAISAAAGSLLFSEEAKDDRPIDSGSGSDSGPEASVSRPLRMPSAKLAFVTGARTGSDMVHVGDRGSQLGVGSGGELLDGAVGEGQWSTRRSKVEGEGALNGRTDMDSADDATASDRDGMNNSSRTSRTAASASVSYINGPSATATAAAVVVNSEGSATLLPVDGGGVIDVMAGISAGRGGDGFALRQYMTAHRAASSSAASSSSSSPAAAGPLSPNLIDSDVLTAPPQRPFTGSAGGGASGAVPTSVAGQGLSGSLSPSALDPTVSLLFERLEQHRPPNIATDIDMSGGQAGQAPSPRPVASSPGGQKGVALNALAPAPSADMSSHVRTHAILRPPDSNDGSVEIEKGLSHATAAAAAATTGPAPVSYAGFGAGAGTTSPRPAAVAGTASVAVASASLPSHNMSDIGSLTAPPTVQRFLPTSSSSSPSSLPLSWSGKMGVTPLDHRGGEHLVDDATVTTAPFLSNPPRDNDHFPINTTAASVTGAVVSSLRQGLVSVAAVAAGLGPDSSSLIHDDALLRPPPHSNLTNHNAVSAAGGSAGGTSAVASAGHQHHADAPSALVLALLEENDSTSPRFFPPQTRSQAQEQTQAQEAQQQMLPPARPLRVPAKVAFSTGTSSHYGPSNAGRELLFNHLGVGSGGELLDGAVGEGWSNLPRARGHQRSGGDDDDNDDVSVDYASVTTMDIEAARKVPGFLDGPSRSSSAGKILTTASNAYHRGKPPHISDAMSSSQSSPSPSSTSSPSSTPTSSAPPSPSHRSSAFSNKKYDPDFLAALSMLKHSLKGVNPLQLLKASEVQAFVDLARESDALREWKLRRASLRPVPLPSSMATAYGDDDGRANAPQEWIEKQQRLRQVPPRPFSDQPPPTDEPSYHPKIRYRLPDGRYLTEDDIDQHQYVPPEIVPKHSPQKVPKFLSFRNTLEASSVFLPPVNAGLGVSVKDEAGLPLDWKTTRLRSTSNAANNSGDATETVGSFFDIIGKGSSSSSAGNDKGKTKASEEILQMLRISLKATSPFKFMTDLSQLQESGPSSSDSGNSEKTQDALLWQERRKNLKPTGSLRRDSIRHTGDDAADLQSVISEQTMESYHGGGDGGQFNDGEIAVANPVEWLEAKKKNLRPTSLRLQSSSHATGADDAMDDQRSVGSELSQSTFTTSRSSVYGYTATSSTTKDPTRKPHSSSFLALLNPLRPVSLAKSSSTPTNTTNTTTSASSQQVIPVDWKLDRLKTTDEIPQPIPIRHGPRSSRTSYRSHPNTVTTPGGEATGAAPIRPPRINPHALAVDYSQARSPSELIKMLSQIKTTPVYPKRIDGGASSSSTGGSRGSESKGGSISGASDAVSSHTTSSNP